MLAGYDQLLAAARRAQWSAEAIDLTADAAAVPGLAAPVRATLAELVAGFRVAERAVAAELAPYVAAAPAGSAARECFTVQAGDEARHARFFDRIAGEVLLPGAAEAGRAAPGVRALFEEELPQMARRLAADHGRLAEAVGLYHLVLEGIAFAVGQDALAQLARDHGLPGIAAGTARVQADERWHLGLGVLQLQELGEPVEVGPAAGRASRAWGPDVATPGRVERVLTVHARRMLIAAGSGVGSRS
jgi:ribonucleoside-diphosphate reductase beta chain